MYTSRRLWIAALLVALGLLLVFAWLPRGDDSAPPTLQSQPQSHEQPSRSRDASLLSANSQGYAQAKPGTTLEFPRDHGEHPAYRIEWWYLTGNLEDDQGQRYGVQYTLFRLALAEPDENGQLSCEDWRCGQMYMAHAALGSADTHRFAEKFSRGGVGLVDVQSQPFSASIEHWRFASEGEELLPIQLHVSEADFSYNLTVSGDARPVLHGDGGFSQKHPSQTVGSYYYSLPHLTLEGEIDLGEGRITVSGEAWIDREWSSQYLSDEQLGWDWLSLHLTEGRALMAFRLRQRDGNHYVYGSLIDASGNVTALDGEQLIMRPLETSEVLRNFQTKYSALASHFTTVPTRWALSLPQHQLELTVEALNPQQWMDTQFPYWEGAVYCQPQSQCRGYLEMTGY